MKMYQLIEWFQVNYPEHHNALLQCNHNFDEKDLNPYHLESDCWSHTMMVCKLAELYNYDTVVLVSALLHDIGKPTARKINPRNNHVQFFGHEALSAEMSVGILNQMIEEKMLKREDENIILELIIHHGFLYKHSEVKEMLEYFDDDKIFCRQLISLIKCDSLGRFTPDLLDEKKFDDMLQYLDSVEYNQKTNE